MTAHLELVIFASSPNASIICTPATAMKMTAAAPATFPRMPMSTGSAPVKRTLSMAPPHQASPVHTTAGGSCANARSERRANRRRKKCMELTASAADRAGDEEGRIENAEDDTGEHEHEKSEQCMFQAIEAF